MSEKRLPCATTGVLACSLMLDHVLHRDGGDDEVRRRGVTNTSHDKLITNPDRE